LTAGMAVSLNAARKTYRSGLGEPIHALDDVNLAVPAGQSLAIIGPSGSGKSTLLHVVGAMDTVDAGTVTVGDQELTALSEPRLAEFRRRIGFVFQRFHLLPALTAVDNVIAPVLPSKVDFDRRARAHELLAAVGLANRAKDLPSQLSGGQQQRVAIARALINRPGLLLADEPTGNLDGRTGSEVLALLAALREEHGLTLLIATHDDAIAGRCDRTVQLVDGALVSDTDHD
jgi:putative ABC transport system ATP-binding protein